MLALDRIPFLSRPSRPPKLDLCSSSSFAEADIEVHVGLTTSSNFYTGYVVEDVTGVFVATYQFLEAGTPVAVTVHLPNRQSIRTVAAVEWHRCAGTDRFGIRPGMGLQFEPLDERAREIVGRFTRVREPYFFVEN